MTLKRLGLGLLGVLLAWYAGGWKGWWLAYALTGLWIATALLFGIGHILISFRQRRNHHGQR